MYTCLYNLTYFMILFKLTNIQYFLLNYYALLR